MAENKLMRRVAGYHDARTDGVTDLLLRARGASVLDVGCNRGKVGFEFYCNGARLVHGCDNYEPGVQFARELFADHRDVQSRFEVVDLMKPGVLVETFGVGQYDITLVLAVIHKLARVMDESSLHALVRQIGTMTTRYFGWRATASDHVANDAERAMLDDVLSAVGLRRIQYSEISDLGPSGIWERGR